MKVENITKIYRTKTSEIKALDNISYEFIPGKMYAIMGHSGSGKSTLISILGLIDTYTSGKISIENKDVSKLKENELADLRMKHIGFVFQDFYLDEHLKAYENIILPMLINKEIKKENRKEKALKLLKELGLEERINHYPGEMSGGECQRVAIARSLANDPQIILADEPTGNLDEENEKLVFSILKDLSKQGKCVIVVTHSEEIKNYADEILTISKGKLEV
ncbi:aBC-type antimicrobial peptide transport system ATPase component [Mycoplasma sp. CAG:776]|nr:aBC-type antimicrobial peptide transport system ATPase component [Mycoplasma sp. CAG:776]